MNIFFGFFCGWVCGVCDVVCFKFLWGYSLLLGFECVGKGRGKGGGGGVGVEMGGGGEHNGRGWRALFCIVALLE